MVGGDVKFPLKESRFLEWYFSDFDEVRDLGYEAMFKLRSDGMFTIITQDLLDRCAEVPTYIFEDISLQENEYISNKQITLIK
jgi:hypothetical protein